jgi:hypothetical protein
MLPEFLQRAILITRANLPIMNVTKYVGIQFLLRHAVTVPHQVSSEQLAVS